LKIRRGKQLRQFKQCILFDEENCFIKLNTEEQMIIADFFQFLKARAIPHNFDQREGSNMKQLDDIVHNFDLEPTTSIMMGFLCSFKIEQEGFSLFCSYNPLSLTFLLEIYDKKTKEAVEYTEE
jgi:hypothetical protein